MVDKINYPSCNEKVNIDVIETLGKCFKCDKNQIELEMEILENE